jgi:hypothetical protein
MGGPPALRPFYIVTVVWGDEYRNFLLEYALPTLLSPRNIPSLRDVRPVRFLFATTSRDWDLISNTAIFRELEKYAEPVFLELPPKGDRPYWLQSIVGHKMCCEMIVRDGAYRIFTSPDALYSDGFLARLHEVALDGAQAVLAVVSPLTRSDLFFKALADMGLLPATSARDSGIPITILARQTVGLAMRAMHGLSRVNEWDASYFWGYAATPWWRIPGSEDAVISGNLWDLLLVDYSATNYDGSILDVRGFDGDFIMHTVSKLETIYFVRDSDELHIVSWASLPEPPSHRHRFSNFFKGVAFRISAYRPVFNAFQRETLFMPTLVHSCPLGEETDTTEQKALQTMAMWLDTPVEIERYSRRLPPHLRSYAGLQAKIEVCQLPWWRKNPVTWRITLRVIVPVARLWIRTREFCTNVSNAAKRVMLALRGDTTSIEKLRWHGKRFLARALRRPLA